MVNKLTIRYTLTFKFNIFGHKLSFRKENIQIISFKIKLLLILYTKLFIKRIQPNVAIKTTYCLLIIFKFIVSMIKFSNFTMFQKIMYVIYSFFNKKTCCILQHISFYIACFDFSVKLSFKYKKASKCLWKIWFFSLHWTISHI